MSKELPVVRPSITSNNLAENVANEELRKTDNFETLKDSYLKLMQQLEIDGIPKEKISTVGQKIVVDKKRNIMKKKGVSPEEIKKINIGSWWYDVAREENYIDPKQSHPATQPERKIVPLTGQEIENIECQQENYQYINVLNNLRDFYGRAIQKLKCNHFMSLLDDDSKVILSLHDLQVHVDIAESFFNHKEKIPENTQHILLHCIGTISSNNDVAAKYFELRDKAHKLTGKQISKYRSGEIKTTLAIFNPTDFVTALLWKYYGVQCKKCESWRVLEVKTGVVKCGDCQNIFKVSSTARCNFCQFPFFEDELKFIREGGKCPNCKEELPEYLLNYIN